LLNKREITLGCVSSRRRQCQVISGQTHFKRASCLSTLMASGEEALLTDK
jgi:hypothetical protein